MTPEEGKKLAAWGPYLRCFKIYAGLGEEYNAGWVWLKEPAYLSRTAVELRIPRGRKTFCEARHLEENFVSAYNDRPRTIKIKHDAEDALVISEWYRNALGEFTTSYHRRGEKTILQVRKLRLWGWRALRVASHHPDMAVRIGARLGMLGTWLAVVGTASWVLDRREPISKLIRETSRHLRRHLESALRRARRSFYSIAARCRGIGCAAVLASVPGTEASKKSAAGDCSTTHQQRFEPVFGTRIQSTHRRI
jgi:hypothetical protein